jgi:aryl-phospho-beta-D-glucosidase BglC (GH1 family)
VSGSPPPPLYLSADQFRTTTTNAAVQLHAYNWFGFNNGQTAVDGLWAGGIAYQTDFAWIIYQLQLLGFNAIRLPFLFG